MDQRLSVLTIAARDPQLLKDFYIRVLGWKPLTENKDIVFFRLNGFLLSICDRKLLSDFIGISFDKEAFSGFTIGYNVESEIEVKKIYEELRGHVRILKEPTVPSFGGLFFYFSDPEGNVVEIAYNPFIELDISKNVIGHKPIGEL